VHAYSHRRAANHPGAAANHPVAGHRGDA